MNREEITSILHELMSKESDHHRGALEAASRVRPELQQIVLIENLSKPLAEVLSEQPEFSNKTGLTIDRLGQVVPFDASDAARALLIRCRRGPSVDAAVVWLEKVLRTDRADVLCVMAVSGITANQRISFEQGIELVPLDELPESKQKESFLRADGLAGTYMSWLRAWQRPKVALTLRVPDQLFMTKETPTDRDRGDRTLKHREFLDDIRLALTCVGPSAPLDTGFWIQYEDPDLEAAVLYSGILGTLHEISPMEFVAEVAVSPVDAQEAVSGFLALRGETRDKVRVALERLNQAMRRRQPGDKAVELSIAFEALLAQGPGENTYKVGLRAALVAGGDGNRRVYNRAIVAAVYSLRSAVVHQGVAPASVKVRGKGKVASSEVVAEGASVAATVTRRVIAWAKVPGWHHFELGQASGT
jgi:hypothetical protein